MSLREQAQLRASMSGYFSQVERQARDQSYYRALQGHQQDVMTPPAYLAMQDYQRAAPWFGDAAACVCEEEPHAARHTAGGIEWVCRSCGRVSLMEPWSVRDAAPCASGMVTALRVARLLVVRWWRWVWAPLLS